MAFYDSTIFEVHVLLVDHDMSTLLETARLLQFNSYKVTPVHDASVASSMLSQGNTTKFNIVMVDVKASNLQGFKLVHEAVSLDLPVIVMATSASPTLVKCAIEDGAFLFMQKPTASEELKYLWQHILREITRKTKEKGKSYGETSSNYNHNQKNYMSGGENFEVDKTTESVTMNRNMSTNKVTGQKGRHEVNSFSSDNNNNNNKNNNVPAGECMSMKPKMCTEWTLELHEKFMAAVKQLGDGRCFPKDILELMNVPGLTRMQVASHLQKCRHGWQPSNERQGRRPKASKSSNSYNPSQSTTKKYGIFPRQIRGSQPQIPVKDDQNNEQVPIATSNNNNIENSMPNSNGTQNMGQQETWDITVPNNNNNNNIMNEIQNGVSSAETPTLWGLGNKKSRQSYPYFIREADSNTRPPAHNGDTPLIARGPPFNNINEMSNENVMINGNMVAASFDFANNFNLNDFNFDHTAPGQATTDAGVATTTLDTSFWSSWIANFAREL